MLSATLFLGSPKLSRSTSPSIIVVGAGAFGGWTALNKREFKYYRLTEKGRKQLVVEEWRKLWRGVMWPVGEES